MLHGLGQHALTGLGLTLPLSGAAPTMPSLELVPRTSPSSGFSACATSCITGTVNEASCATPYDLIKCLCEDPHAQTDAFDCLAAQCSIDDLTQIEDASNDCASSAASSGLPAPSSTAHAPFPSSSNPASVSAISSATSITPSTASSAFSQLGSTTPSTTGGMNSSADHASNSARATFRCLLGPSW
ncbi:hypothetical protein BV20DRAFT_872231 [Pilatotrama ljubarskyi]|nr:hypothetical protein BV20DRAFT_872231 [Pilatotrama ljubarskyi]